MKIFIALVIYLLFWLCCMAGTGSDKKNILNIKSYPDIVQNKVKENGSLNTYIKDKNNLIAYINNLFVFTISFSLVGLVCQDFLGLVTYLDIFIYFLCLGEGLALFDYLFIDLVWWRNSKRIRFSFLQDRELYQDPKNHFKAYLKSIPLFIIVAILTSFILKYLER